jgi:dihydropteroate synthase
VSALYIRPVARLPQAAMGSRSAGPPGMAVAGRSDLLFAAAELIEREGGQIRRRWHLAGDLLGGGVALDGLAGLLDRVCGPRGPIGNLPLDHPRIMGIINVTPDSFSDGGLYLTRDAAVEHALELEAQGADILDIGGESTRPGSEGVDLEEECRRVLPVIAALAKRSRARLSIDTRKAEMMRRAALEGAQIINDVSALTHDPKALENAARCGLAIILTHTQGEPRNMQDSPTYADVALDVFDWLQARIEACEGAGIARTRLLVDPGIGFGKTPAHNVSLLGSLSLLHGLGCPLVLGASRKSFVGALTGAGAADRLAGSIASALAGADQGVQILRVHDVAATRQALTIWEASRVDR